MTDVATLLKPTDLAVVPDLEAIPKRRRAAVSGTSIADYLIRRLIDHGINDVFGIPGDYILSFYSMMEQSPLNLVGCTREDCAGFAADAYARIRGIGALCVTYAVGGLSACNSIAGAYAEKSPIVVISGSPGKQELKHHPLLHHRVRDFRTQSEIFKHICCATTVLDDPDTALREIDRVFDTIVRSRRPGYIELPRDMVRFVPEAVYHPVDNELVSDYGALDEATDEVLRRLDHAERPCILAGVEIMRFGLQDKLLAMAETLNIPITTTLLGKSVISESHPLFAGVYEGTMGHEDVTKFVESSDLVLVLGAFLTDLNLSIYTAKLDPQRCVYATSEVLKIGHHRFDGVLLSDLIESITELDYRASRREPPISVIEVSAPTTWEEFQPHPDRQITITQLIRRLNLSLDESMIVIADVGDALFASADLMGHHDADFMSPAYYAALGFAVPAALGVAIARPDSRPVVLTGDGSFQMNAMELSSLIKHGASPIVIVLDNEGYGTERLLHPGENRFNDIRPWNYSRLPDLLGGGTGYEIRTEEQFDRALESAIDDTSGPSILHVHLLKDDWSDSLRRLADALRDHV